MLCTINVSNMKKKQSKNIEFTPHSQNQKSVCKSQKYHRTRKLNDE